MFNIINEIICAGLSAVLTVTIVHPFDVVKTRFQLSGKNNVRNYKELGIPKSIMIIYKEEGIASFWKGIKAAWLRESTYTSLRLGLYDPIKHAIGITNQSSFMMKFTAGSLAGAIGSLVGNPFDVIKTRMMSIESKQIPSFYNVFSDIYKTNKLEFYNGLQANVLRACVLNGTKMACYDQIKSAITKRNIIKNELAIQFCSAFSAGFFMAVAVSPFDMIRTQLMTQNKYKNFVDCLLQIFKNQGLKGFYAGFLPIWSRFAPTTTLQLLFFERLKKIINV
jgi:hypothetical protein